MSLRHLFTIGAALLLPALSVDPANAQSTLLQGGPWQAGRAPMYVGQGSAQAVVQDSGAAGGGGPGLGFAELMLAARGTGTAPHVAQGTGPLGTNFCDYDGPTTNPTGYHFLCLSANAGTGGAVLTYGAGGGAASLPFNAVINGVTYPFPFAVAGIVGPSTTVVGDLPTWGNTAGTLLSDSGIPISTIATQSYVQGRAGYVTAVFFNGTGNITAPTTPENIILGKTVPATTTVTLPGASNWPNCALQLPGACPVYRVKDFARNSATFPITVTAADGAPFVYLASASSFVINANGAEFGFTLIGSTWSVN
jgi:hypothetical protein